MKLAELKRKLVKGTKLRLVDSLIGTCDKARVVAMTNSVGVMFTGDGIKDGQFSHLDWPKASQLVETEKGFKIVEDGETSAGYIWV